MQNRTKMKIKISYPIMFCIGLLKIRLSGFRRLQLLSLPISTVSIRCLCYSRNRILGGATKMAFYVVYKYYKQYAAKLYPTCQARTACFLKSLYRIHWLIFSDSVCFYVTIMCHVVDVFYVCM